MRKVAWNLCAALIIPASGLLLTLPHPSAAQEQKRSPVVGLYQPVSVNYDKADIRQALKQLFDSTGANYTIDPSVEKGLVTASLERVPLHYALETILRASPIPLTYRFESGIYNILPKAYQEIEAQPVRTTTIKIRHDQLIASAKTIVERLKGLPQFGPQSGINYIANPDDNSIIVTFMLGPAGEEKFQQLRDAVRLYDVLPPKITARVEVVLLVQDKSGRKHKSVLSSFGSTISEHEIQLKTMSDGESTVSSGLRLTSGSYDVRVNPVVNGDQSLSYDAHGTLEFTYRLPGSSAPLHLRKEFSGADRMRSGNTVVITSAIQKFGEGKSTESVEMLVFLTLNEVRQLGTPAGGPILDPTR